TEALRSASERLDAALQDVREVTADPDVSSNLKQTAQNLNEATAYARDVAQRVDRFLASGGPKINVTLPRPKFQSGTRFILESAGSGAGKVRTDLTLTVPTGNDTGLRFGLYDFTDGNRLIAQRLQWLDAQTATRYGIFGGRLGLGLDYVFNPRFNVSADLYDPKYPRLDVRGHYNYTGDLAVVFGLDGVLREPRAVVGLQLRK
ncbi:MAG: hypothetical protein QHJ73_00770, partial [Armatimonadota bacterium]|nr:hypothetical protein [Armatimonadota bacterium]